ncbi:outer membrane beta-barrel protein [Dyella sp.]|jgi:hypothetical protein|uniref:outer membrane beta-barrel protein n=1 Tax=Dyella sp. TaxID=1869338 RepID=UPI002D778B05|nr:outer membrane beta-barrel protein [Dyella sp.]HET6434057.1 outer membrane beta-barrel protein [Dyella sp.]
MKLITRAAVVGALALASTSAFAGSTGNFFINAGIGQAQYHVGRTDGLGYKLDEKDTAGALRFGYAWHVGPAVDLGVEGGYVDLGKLVASYHYQNAAADYFVDEHADLNATGWLAGVNGRFEIAPHWYVSARGGWLHSSADATYSYRETGYTGAYASGSANGDGWYGGVGVGYDFTRDFSLGLNYDNYHAKADIDNALGSVDSNIGAFTVTAEFRF